MSVPSIYMVGGHVLGGGAGIFAIAGVAPSFQLATGHYTPAVFQPIIVSPRPDTETNTWERHRLCPAGIPWRFPAAMAWGAWPYQYAITAGPSGLTIGATFGSSNYGIMNWTSPVVGTYTVTVQITTQDFGRTAGSQDPTGQYSVSFTLVVAATTDARFFMVDAVNGSNSNSGSFASPWQTLSGFSAGSTSGGQVFFRNGTYNLTAINAVLDLTSKARVWVGYPGETAEINYGGTWGGTNCYIAFTAGSGSSGGASASNLDFFGSPSNWSTLNSSGNFDLYHINGFGDRQVYYENTFDSLNGQNVVAANFSNWSGVAMFANANMHNYTAIINNTFQNFSQMASGGAVINYSIRYWVWEGNTVQGFTAPHNVQQGLITKGHCSQGSMRRNFIPLQSISTACCFQPQGDDGNQGDDPNSNETCWNFATLAPPGNNGELGSAQIYGPATFNSWTGWTHSNTIVGANYLTAATGFPCTLLSTRNILCTEHGIQNDATHYGTVGPLTLTTGPTADVVDSYSNRASVVDANGQLLSAYAAANGITLGTVGWVPL